MNHSFVVRGAEVYDGMGAGAVRSNVYVEDGRVSHVGNDGPSMSEVINAEGLALAPGFIDVHTHDDAALIADPGMTAKLSQGITTVITGMCGFSCAPLPTHAKLPDEFSIVLPSSDWQFESLASYNKAVAAAKPAVNYLPLVGHSSLRVCAMENLDRAATCTEIRTMQYLLREALEAGAAGLSTGLAYNVAKHAPTSEVVELATLLGEFDGLYVTHIRNEGDRLLESVQEALFIGRSTNVATVFSHHKAIGSANFGLTRQSLAAIDHAGKTQQVALDVYPYTYSSTALSVSRVERGGEVLITRSEAHPEFVGMTIHAVAAKMGKSLKETVDALQPAGAIYHTMADEDLERVLVHPKTMIGSDGLPFDEHPHPRLWGSFPRVLGYYAREKGTLSLSTAIHKMTGLPAALFGLKRRGRIAAGCHADLVLFDPAVISDTATIEKPMNESKGIHRVWISGTDPGIGTGRRLRSQRNLSNR